MKIELAAAALLVLTSCAPAESPVAAARAPERQETCIAAPNRLCPSDEGAADPSFAKYRQSMLDAANQSDEKKLRALIDSKIRTTFGGERGVIPMSELKTVLAMGGSFRGTGAERSFWAPYVYGSWPETVDAFSHVAAIHRQTVIRAAPASSSPEVARVDWEILELVPDLQQETHAGWRHVRTAEKKDGWVEAADVRSPIAYRAGFSKRSGEWKMEAFVKGD